MMHCPPGGSDPFRRFSLRGLPSLALPPQGQAQRLSEPDNQPREKNTIPASESVTHKTGGRAGGSLERVECRWSLSVPSMDDVEEADGGRLWLWLWLLLRVLMLLSLASKGRKRRKEVEEEDESREGEEKRRSETHRVPRAAAPRSNLSLVVN